MCPSYIVHLNGKTYLSAHRFYILIQIVLQYRPHALLIFLRDTAVKSFIIIQGTVPPVPGKAAAYISAEKIIAPCDIIIPYRACIHLRTLILIVKHAVAVSVCVIRQFIDQKKKAPGIQIDVFQIRVRLRRIFQALSHIPGIFADIPILFTGQSFRDLDLLLLFPRIEISGLVISDPVIKFKQISVPSFIILLILPPCPLIIPCVSSIILLRKVTGGNINPFFTCFYLLTYKIIACIFAIQPQVRISRIYSVLQAQVAGQVIGHLVAHACCVQRIRLQNPFCRRRHPCHPCFLGQRYRV